jgi:uncharacterized protein YodC (DUF2158 family)
MEKPMKTFNPGDTVRHERTGLEMEVVEHKPETDMVLCEWLDRDVDHNDAYFQAAQLVLVKAARVKSGEKIVT